MLGRREKPHDVVMRNAAALRLARGAACIKDVAQIRRITFVQKVRRALGNVLKCDEHSLLPCRQSIREMTVREKHGRLGVCEHEFKAFRRVGEVDRKIGRTRFQDSKQPDDQRRTPLHAQPHNGAGRDAICCEVRSDRGGALIEFTIGEPFLTLHERRCVRVRSCALGEQRMQRPAIAGIIGGVLTPGAIDQRGLLGGIDQRHINDAFGNRQRRENGAQMPQHPRGRRVVDFRAIVFGDNPETFARICGDTNGEVCLLVQPDTHPRSALAGFKPGAEIVVFENDECIKERLPGGDFAVRLDA